MEEQSKKIPIFDPTQDLSLAPQRRMRRGMGSKQLLESEILEVQQKARSAMEAARLLGVSYNTYKKYCRQYGILENLKNPKGNGIRKGYNITKGQYALEDILEGKYPEYPPYRLKKRILLNGYMLEKCSNCGFEERRITDNKVPLVLDFIDDDRTNHKYDNLRMLCLNCAFLIRGDLSGSKYEYTY